MTAILEARDVRVSLGHLPRARILHGVDLTVQPGEIVGLIGETGSGKTTFARTVLGLDAVESGSLRIDGRDTTALSGRERRAFRREGTVQYVFQDPLRSLDPDRTVFESVAEPLAIRREPRPAVREAVYEALDLVGLPAVLADRHPGEISGGQRQRVAVARALVVRPRLLICDEPVSALDAASRVHVLDLLARLRAERGLAILLITHDLGTLAGLADSVAVLYRGRVVEQGTTREVLTTPHAPYTRLLVASVPTIDAGADGADADLAARERRALRVALRAESSVTR